MKEHDDSSRLKLLELLRAANGKIVPSAVMTEKLGLTRQAVFKLITGLREEGIEILSMPQKGYALEGDLLASDVLSPTLVDLMMKTCEGYCKCIYLPEVDSTQSVVKKLAAQDAPSGIVALTDSQTQGRGRRGRSWLASAGKNLTFSVLLRPALKPGDVQLLNLAAGIAVQNALVDCCGVPAELKWPNDVMIGKRKICGILSEAAGEPDRIYYSVTGMGINVNAAREDFPPELAEIAASVFTESGRKFSRPMILTKVLNLFFGLAKKTESVQGREDLLERYKKTCATLGSEIRIVQDDEEFVGIASGLTEQGALVVKTDIGEKIFAAADVHHLRTRN